jgi:hypothetical protein
MKKQIVHSLRSSDVVRPILALIVLMVGTVLGVAAVGDNLSLRAQNETSAVIGGCTETQEKPIESEDELDDQDATETTIQVEPFLPVGPPVVTTRAANPIAKFSARLNGLLNPHGLPTTFHFQYGRTASYGRTTVPHTRTGNTAQPVFANISGLTPHTRYHFRIVASNSHGTRYGADRTFTTTTASTCNITGTWVGTISGTFFAGSCFWTGTAFISAVISQNGTVISGPVNYDGIPCFNPYTCGIFDFAQTTGYVTGSTANCPTVVATYHGTVVSGACSGQTINVRATLTLNGNTLIGTSPGFTLILTRQR